jgi:hypothetical protein
MSERTMSLPTRESPTKRRRPWLIATPLVLVIVLAAGWSVFWFYAARQANIGIADWHAREAKAGRDFTCASQTIEGFPFRLEVRCADPGLELQNLNPAITLTAKSATVLAQVYDPTLLIGEFAGPLTIGETGRAPTMSANWTLGQMSVRGPPGAPERASFVLDNPEFARTARATMESVAAAKHLELHGRLLDRVPNENATVEIALKLNGGTAPILHQALTQPTDADIDAVISGLRDISPKPLVAHLRELAASKGQIDIRQVRISQGDILAIGSGALTLTPDGLLDGRVTMTIAGLDKLITLLGLDQMMTQYMAQRGGGMTMDKISSSLDRILPGLGGAMRNNSGSIAAAGISMLGEPRDLEGRKAISVPLRFAAGTVYLGPLEIGRMSPLF